MTLNNGEAAVATSTDGGMNLDLDGVMDTLSGVFGFFRTIIDFLKGIFTPLFESLLGSIIGGNEAEG